MLEGVIDLYDQFLSAFPFETHFWISLIIFIVLIYWLFKLIHKNLGWLVLLIIFVPASVPLLKQIGKGLLEFLQYLLNK